MGEEPALRRICTRHLHAGSAKVGEGEVGEGLEVEVRRRRLITGSIMMAKSKSSGVWRAGGTTARLPKLARHSETRSVESAKVRCLMLTCAMRGKRLMSVASCGSLSPVGRWVNLLISRIITISVPVLFISCLFQINK